MICAQSACVFKLKSHDSHDRRCVCVFGLVYLPVVVNIRQVFSSVVHRDGSFSQPRQDVLIFISLWGRLDSTDWDESARSLIDECLDTKQALFPSIVCWHLTGLKTGNLPQKHTHTHTMSSPNARDEDVWKCFQNYCFRV